MIIADSGDVEILFALHHIERKCCSYQHQGEDTDGETNKKHGTYGFQRMTMRLQNEILGVGCELFQDPPPV